MLADSIKWRGDTSDPTPPTPAARSFDSNASIDSIKHTKHIPNPNQPNLPPSHNGPSRHWKQPFSVVARGCKSVLPNIRTLLTKSLKRATQNQQPVASAIATPSDTTITSPKSAPVPPQDIGTLRPLDLAATETTRGPKPDFASRVSVSSFEDILDEERSIFVARAPIQVYNGPGDPHDGKRPGIVLYDSGCQFDLISAAYIADRGKPDKDVPKKPFAMSITGEHYEYSGTVKIRWYDPRFKMLGYMSTECRIVKSDFFEVIIGSRFIERHRLFVPNPVLIGPIISEPPKVDSSSTAKNSRAQTAKLKRDQELQAQDEEERRLEQAQTTP